MIYQTKKHRNDVDMNLKTVYVAKIKEYTEKHLGGNLFVISDVIVSTGLDCRLFTVSLATGQKLYNYLTMDDRLNRLRDIRFQFVTIYERQHITDFKAFDAKEWIGDIISRERLEHEQNELRLLAAKQKAKAMYLYGWYDKLDPDDGDELPTSYGV